MMEVKKFPVEIRFLGGTREVGRIAIAAKTDESQVLLDYGVMMDREPGFPMHIAPREVDALILTHCHLDHSGALPVFYIQDKSPLYATRLTLELMQLLIKDFIHLSGYYLPFEYLELRTMMQSSVYTRYRETRKVGDIVFHLLDAGHIPGSAQVILEAEGKRILFTSDFNISKTRLLSSADDNYGELDAVIIETTYASDDHTDRLELEKSFVTHILEVVEKGGTVLVPAFSIGRSQEIACLLAAHHFEYPVTIDGMARAANRIMMDNTSVLRDSRLFMEAVHGAMWVDGWRDRRIAAKKSGVIISPAGLLKGGPAAFYISKLGKKSNNAVYLVSYQIPGTPGRELMEKGMCVIDGKMRKIKAQVAHFDFSSHCGANQLKEVVKNLKGQPTVFTVHGAEGNCERFARWVKRSVGLKAVAPKAGDRFTV
ncbi:MAG: MBL fold metallo-hydrolase [Candidatus Bathyarchaeota archaeon]|nr:MAG: MBL fold metallo-hydrolase [Candidatus Bathyarchaeota archaeon]